MKDLESTNYKVVIGSGQGRGTFIIVRKNDNKTTLRYVCSEGLAVYKNLKRAFRRGTFKFDALCAIDDFID